MSNAGREIVGPGFSRTPVIRVLDQRVSRERWQVTRGGKEFGDKWSAGASAAGRNSRYGAKAE
jgi:hypothetical protein